MHMSTDCNIIVEEVDKCDYKSAAQIKMITAEGHTFGKCLFSEFQSFNVVQGLFRTDTTGVRDLRESKNETEQR